MELTLKAEGIKERIALWLNWGPVPLAQSFFGMMLHAWLRSRRSTRGTIPITAATWASIHESGVNSEAEAQFCLT